MTALALLRRFWPAIPILALAIALWLSNMATDRARTQRDAVQAAFDKTVADYRTAAATRKAADLQNVTRVADIGTGISKETVDDYQAKIDQLRRDYALGLRADTKTGGGNTANASVPDVPETAGRADGATCQASLSARDALTASETAERLIALQAWAGRVSEVDVNGE